jgi:hypothetical protein
MVRNYFSGSNLTIPLLDHAAKHSLAPGQNHAHNHDRQNEEKQAHQVEEPAASVAKPLLILHLHVQLFGAGDVQCEVGLGADRWLQEKKYK